MNILNKNVVLEHDLVTIFLHIFGGFFKCLLKSILLF
jgi:hypothetical protein